MFLNAKIVPFEKPIASIDKTIHFGLYQMNTQYSSSAFTSAQDNMNFLHGHQIICLNVIRPIA